MALVVLGDLCVRVGRRVTHDDRHRLQSGSLGSTQALGAEVNAVVASRVRAVHNDRLQDAVLADVICELFEFGLKELGTRIVRVLEQQCGVSTCWGRPSRVAASIAIGAPESKERIEQIGLGVVRLVPRHAHEHIVRRSGCGA